MSIDKLTIMYLFIIVGVGISSFGLGRLSVGSIDGKLNEYEAKSIVTTEAGILSNPVQQQIEPTGKRYVASKNGKMYYSLGCGGAKRIKPENEVWFGSKEDAEKSGYTLSSTCK